MSRANESGSEITKNVNVEEMYQPLDDAALSDLGDQIAEWKRKYHDRILFIEVPGTLTHAKFNGIFRVPDQRELQAVAKSGTEGMENDAELVRTCVLWPDPMVLNFICKRDYGIVTPIARKIMAETQILAEASVKKL